MENEPGVGEKIVVFESPLKGCDLKKIKAFFEAMPDHMREEMIVLGVANYCLGSKNNDFIQQVHEALFPNCKRKDFVRYG